jgi:hypothetical protein
MNTNYNYIFEILKKLKFKNKYYYKIINKFNNSFTFYEKFFNKKDNNLFGGGEIELKKEIFIYNDYKFLVRVLKDNENNNIIIKISSKLYGFCLLMSIYKDLDYVQIENISNFPDCAINTQLPYRGGGKILLNVAINYLRKNYDIYKRKRIVLADNSKINCFDSNNKNRTLFLAPLTTLKKGQTWYGMFGFRPFDNIRQIPSNRSLRWYKENYEKLQNLKLKDNQFIIKMILDTDKKYNYKIINEHIIKQIINKNKDILVKDFIQQILEIDKFCIIFEKIYIEILQELKLHNFMSESFYLDFKLN